VIANLALDGLEAKLREKYPKASNASRKAKANLVRFADDFIITGSSKELLEKEIKPLVEQFMKERGLELSQEKTHITHIAIGFDFLGQNIRKYKDGKVLVKPSKKNVKMFLTKIRKLIKENAQATAGNLIVQLNPKIRGWANYHRHVSSKQTFVKVDDAIFRALWQWAKRRHPNKSERWVKEKYFHSIEQRNRVFCGQGEEQDGTIRNVQLFYAHTVPIERHTKIKGDANPYDPRWEMYFEERLGVKMVHNLKGKRQLIYLWKEQNGLCPICHQKITKLTGWNNHHIVRKVEEGRIGKRTECCFTPTVIDKFTAKGFQW
jgi:RNA-directed DNA polymerase